MTSADDLVLCPRHPAQEATLRCIRCDGPMCAACAQPTATGYMCPQCLRRQEDRFFSTEPQDYPLTFAVCLAGNLVACLVMMLFNIWWIGIFVGGALGGAAATFARRLTPRRVGRYSARAAIAGAVVGAWLAAVLFVLLRFGRLDLFLGVQVYALTLIVCTLGFAVAVYTTYQRRI